MANPNCVGFVMFVGLRRQRELEAEVSFVSSSISKAIQGVKDKLISVATCMWGMGAKIGMGRKGSKVISSDRIRVSEKKLIDMMPGDDVSEVVVICVVCDGCKRWWIYERGINLDW